MDLTVYRDLSRIVKVTDNLNKNQKTIIKAIKYLFIFAIINFLFTLSIAVALCVCKAHAIKAPDVKAQLEDYFETNVAELAQIQDEKFELLYED